MTTLRILAKDSLWFQHAMLTFVLLWWSFVLCGPNLTFTTTPIFAAFASIGTQMQWGVTSGIIGAFGILGIAWERARLPATHALCFMHCVIAILIALPNWRQTGVGMYGVMGASSIFLLWNRTR